MSWEKDTPAYDPARYGRPWCAEVIEVDVRGKLVYRWGAWTGRDGGEGLCHVECEPGDVIAYGQRDRVDPPASEHVIAIVEADGSLTKITPVEAAKRLPRVQPVVIPVVKRP